MTKSHINPSWNPPTTHPPVQWQSFGFLLFASLGFGQHRLDAPLPRSAGGQKLEAAAAPKVVTSKKPWGPGENGGIYRDLSHFLGENGAFLSWFIWAIWSHFSGHVMGIFFGVHQPKLGIFQDLWMIRSSIFRWCSIFQNIFLHLESQIFPLIFPKIKWLGLIFILSISCIGSLSKRRSKMLLLCDRFAHGKTSRGQVWKILRDQ